MSMRPKLEQTPAPGYIAKRRDWDDWDDSGSTKVKLWHSLESTRTLSLVRVLLLIGKVRVSCCRSLTCSALALFACGVTRVGSSLSALGGENFDFPFLVRSFGQLDLPLSTLDASSLGFVALLQSFSRLNLSMSLFNFGYLGVFTFLHNLGHLEFVPPPFGLSRLEPSVPVFDHGHVGLLVLARSFSYMDSPPSTSDMSHCGFTLSLHSFLCADSPVFMPDPSELGLVVFFQSMSQLASASFVFGLAWLGFPSPADQMLNAESSTSLRSPAQMGPSAAWLNGTDDDAPWDRKSMGKWGDVPYWKTTTVHGKQETHEKCLNVVCSLATYSNYVDVIWFLDWLISYDFMSYDWKIYFGLCQTLEDLSTPEMMFCGLQMFLEFKALLFMLTHLGSCLSLRAMQRLGPSISAFGILVADRVAQEMWNDVKSW